MSLATRKKKANEGSSPLGMQSLNKSSCPQIMVLEAEQGAHSLGTSQDEAGDQLGRSMPPPMVKCHHTHASFYPFSPPQPPLAINLPNSSFIALTLTLAQDILSLPPGAAEVLSLTSESLETSYPSLVKSLSRLANRYCAYSSQCKREMVRQTLPIIKACPGGVGTEGS